MTEPEIFVLSERALADVFDQVGLDQWGQTRPEWFQTGHRGVATLRELVNYHAQDSAWVPDVLAGRTIAEVGAVHDGDLLGTDAAAGYRTWSDRAIAAAEALDDLDKAVHLSYGDFPAREYLKHVTSFRGFRAYDFARWIGASTQLPPALVQGLWDERAPEVEVWRSMGVFGAVVPVPDDAPLQDRLLGLVGRDPRPSQGDHSG